MRAFLDGWFVLIYTTQVYYTGWRMRSAQPSGEVSNVNLSWFHSFAASLWDCCYWSLADVSTGEDRLEGEFPVCFPPTAD